MKRIFFKQFVLSILLVLSILSNPVLAGSKKDKLIKAKNAIIKLLKMEFKDANFTIICKAHSQDVFRKKGICEFIIDDGDKINLLKSIRNKHYDLGILFHNTLKDAVIFKLANIDKIIGYNNEGRKVFLDFQI